MAGPTGYQRSWPRLKASTGIYATVMLPICGLELFLLLANSPAWMRWSAGAMLVLTTSAFYRGYVRRLVLGEQGARLRGLLGSTEIPWSCVRIVGVYVPGGGLGARR